jgi:hypothetical protein
MARLTMVFITYLFVFYFLPLVLVFYYALDGLSREAGESDGRTCIVLNTHLVLASSIFYGWCNPRFIFMTLRITVVNYVCGRIIGLPGISRRLRRQAHPSFPSEASPQSWRPLEDGVFQDREQERRTSGRFRGLRWR